jgi:tRNA dimethylallyltransferase
MPKLNPIQRVFVIVGPTSSGKTSLALNLCREFKGEVVSADSRQIYKYMDIGTGKIPPGSDLTVKKGELKWVFNGINVWGYDLVKPGEYFSAYDYALFTLNKIKELGTLEKTTFLVGGTGFYVDAVSGRVPIKGGKPDLVLRSELEKLPLDSLREKLTSLNLGAPHKIDINNRVRLIRAIEKEIMGKNNATPLPYLKNAEFVYFGLTADRKLLYEGADRWLDNVWGGGLLEEVSGLIDKGFADTPQLKGLVYKSAFDFVKNASGEKEAVQRAKYDLHAYIRRQITWFKKNPEIEWFDVTERNFSQKIYNKVKSKVDG